MDKLDTITMDVPLFIRALEHAREDLKTDVDLHVFVDRVLKASKTKDVLTIEDYDSMVPVTVQAAQRLKAARDTSKNFAFVPNLLSATVDADDNEIRIVVITRGQPDKAVRLRMSRTVDYAAQAMEVRVHEQGSTQENGTWVFDYVLRP